MRTRALLHCCVNLLILQTSIGPIIIREKHFQHFLLLSWACSGTISSCGITLAPAPSSTSSIKRGQAPKKNPRGTSKRAPRGKSQPKTSPKARKNKPRRERQKTVLAKTKATIADPREDPAKSVAKKDTPMPAQTRAAITVCKFNGKRRCPFYN